MIAVGNNILDGKATLNDMVTMEKALIMQEAAREEGRIKGMVIIIQAIEELAGRGNAYWKNSMYKIADLLTEKFINKK